MGFASDIEADGAAALAALAWQLDMGVDEAIGDTPVSAYDLPEKAPWQQRAPAQRSAVPAQRSAEPARPAAPVARTDGAVMAAQEMAAQEMAAQEMAAQEMAARCQSLPELDAAAAGFDLCELRKGARSAVAGMGPNTADLLILCDPPSPEAEKSGLALSGLDLEFLKKVFAAIGLSLDMGQPATALHLAPILPWPLRGAAEQQSQAIAMMRPFSIRRIALMRPKLVVLMGHAALAQMIPSATLSRARGQIHTIVGGDGLGGDGMGGDVQAYPMAMPAISMKSALAKREAWADALAIKAALLRP